MRKTQVRLLYEFLSYPHQQVKMVAKQAIGVDFGDPEDMASQQFQEESKVLILEEKAFTIYTAIVNMVPVFWQ